MPVNNYTKNYKKISDAELQRSYLIARYPPGTININDIYGLEFVNTNTGINNTTDIIKTFSSGKCVKKITSSFPKQDYNIVNPDGTKVNEFFTNRYLQEKYTNLFDGQNLYNYNFYKYVFSFILILLLIFLNKYLK